MCVIAPPGYGIIRNTKDLRQFLLVNLRIKYCDTNSVIYNSIHYRRWILSARLKDKESQIIEYQRIAYIECRLLLIICVVLYNICVLHIRYIICIVLFN